MEPDTKLGLIITTSPTSHNPDIRQLVTCFNKSYGFSKQQITHLTIMYDGMNLLTMENVLTFLYGMRIKDGAPVSDQHLKNDINLFLGKTKIPELNTANPVLRQIPVLDTEKDVDIIEKYVNIIKNIFETYDSELWKYATERINPVQPLSLYLEIKVDEYYKNRETEQILEDERVRKVVVQKAMQGRTFSELNIDILEELVVRTFYLITSSKFAKKGIVTKYHIMPYITYINDTIEYFKENYPSMITSFFYAGDAINSASDISDYLKQNINFTRAIRIAINDLHEKKVKYTLITQHDLYYYDVEGDNPFDTYLESMKKNNIKYMTFRNSPKEGGSNEMDYIKKHMGYIPVVDFDIKIQHLFRERCLMECMSNRQIDCLASYRKILRKVKGIEDDKEFNAKLKTREDINAHCTFRKLILQSPLTTILKKLKSDNKINQTDINDSIDLIYNIEGYTEALDYMKTLYGFQYLVFQDYFLKTKKDKPLLYAYLNTTTLFQNKFDLSADPSNKGTFISGNNFEVGMNNIKELLKNFHLIIDEKNIKVFYNLVTNENVVELLADGLFNLLYVYFIIINYLSSGKDESCFRLYLLPFLYDRTAIVSTDYYHDILKNEDKYCDAGTYIEQSNLNEKHLMKYYGDPIDWWKNHKTCVYFTNDLTTCYRSGRDIQAIDFDSNSNICKIDIKAKNPTGSAAAAPAGPTVFKKRGGNLDKYFTLKRKYLIKMIDKL